MHEDGTTPTQAVAPALVAAATAVAGGDRRIVTAGQLAQCLNVEVPLAVLLIDSVAALTPAWLQVCSSSSPLLPNNATNPVLSVAPSGRTRPVLSRFPV